MASRRRRSRRSWSRRLRRGLIRHTSIVLRCVLVFVMLAELWLLWPYPRHRAVDQRAAAGARHQSIAPGEPGEGLVAVAQASSAAAVKPRPVGEPAAVQYRLGQRLQQVTKTMPGIGMPEPAPVDPTVTESNLPAELSQPEQGVNAGNVSAVLAGKGPGSEPAAPPAAILARDGAAKEQATTAQHRGDGI